jgi:membrane associated rhomboid family serine protease
MGLGPISRLAAEFERKAPKGCVLGMRVFVVAFLIALAGALIAATVDIDVGYVVAVFGFLGGFVGMAIYAKGFFFDRRRDAP